MCWKLISVELINVTSTVSYEKLPAKMRLSTLCSKLLGTKRSDRRRLPVHSTNLFIPLEGRFLRTKMYCHYATSIRVKLFAVYFIKYSLFKNASNKNYTSRFHRVLTMVYNTQNYSVFGLFPSSDILETRKQDVSETGSVSVLRWGGMTPTQLGPLERANLDQQFWRIIHLNEYYIPHCINYLYDRPLFWKICVMLVNFLQSWFCIGQIPTKIKCLRTILV
jgi:hypothetical protein